MEADQTADEALERTDQSIERISQWKIQLQRLSTGSLPEIEEASFLGRELRAASVIAVMAELEALLKDMLHSVSNFINASGLTVKELIPELRPLAVHSRFESLINTNDATKSWDHRIELSQLNIFTETASLPGPSSKGPPPPLDGRTIQLRHISTVWKVLGMGTLNPPSSTIVALRKLSSLRNDVAHRNQEIKEVFSNADRTAKNMSDYMEAMIDLFTNIGIEWSDYLRNERFKEIQLENTH